MKTKHFKIFNFKVITTAQWASRKGYWKNTPHRWLYSLGVWFGLIFFFATGCRSVQPVIVEKIKIEYRDRLRVDSIYNRDTVQIYGRNDTVFKDVIRWRERFRIDTVSVVKIDSIPYPVEVVQEVNRLTKWQRWRLTMLNIIGGLIIAYIAFRIGRAKLLL